MLQEKAMSGFLQNYTVQYYRVQYITICFFTLNGSGIFCKTSLVFGKTFPIAIWHAVTSDRYLICISMKESLNTVMMFNYKE